MCLNFCRARRPLFASLLQEMSLRAFGVAGISVMSGLIRWQLEPVSRVAINDLHTDTVRQREKADVDVRIA